MKPTATNWVAVVHKAGKRLETFKIPEGVTTIGRDPTNQIPLPNSSVSREHAEITCRPDGLMLRDLDSRNGVLVNGVPRKKAMLQPGDKLTICEFVVEIATAVPADATGGAKPAGLAAALQLEQTIDLRPRLPEARTERALATLYHVCFWIAEGLEEKLFNERCLNLLLESLQAREVHFFSGDLELKAVITEDGGKPLLNSPRSSPNIFRNPARLPSFMEKISAGISVALVNTIIWLALFVPARPLRVPVRSSS